MAKYRLNNTAAHPPCAADNYHLDAFILQATAAGKFLALCQRLRIAQGVVFLMSSAALHFSPELRQPLVQLYHMCSKGVLLVLSKVQSNGGWKPISLCRTFGMLSSPLTLCQHHLHLRLRAAECIARPLSKSKPPALEVFMLCTSSLQISQVAVELAVMTVRCQSCSTPT